MHTDHDIYLERLQTRTKLQKALKEEIDLTKKLGTQIHCSFKHNTFLKDVTIQQRIKYIIKNRIYKPSLSIVDETSKYFIEKPGKQYASGISVKKFNENQLR